MDMKQTHVEELEAINFSLLRRMFGKNKLEWGRERLMKWAHDQNLKIYPLEWVMMKLQLRYAGHEVRVAEEDVHKLPHNMLFRGHLAGKQRLRGGLEQAYPATLTRAVECCGLPLDDWVDMAKNRGLWKTFLEDLAVVRFMEGWYEREKSKKLCRDRQRRLAEGVADSCSGWDW